MQRLVDKIAIQSKISQVLKFWTIFKTEEYVPKAAAMTPTVIIMAHTIPCRNITNKRCYECSNTQN